VSIISSEQADPGARRHRERFPVILVTVIFHTSTPSILLSGTIVATFA
jgi:hypothetical protein